ncbi:MAG: O-antigen ligase family protein, partial [Anaerolineales bacterium]
IVEGTDTIGDRYQFIESGFHMWLDNIIGGVGIGQYPQHLMLYVTSLLPPDRLQMGAHNMYIQVLAETGLVGLMLFVAMLASCVRSLWLTRRSPDTTNSSLAQTWLVVMVIMLLGGITKHDHYDKLIWLVMGISFVLPKHSDLPSRMTPGQEDRSGRRFLRVHSLDG